MVCDDQGCIGSLAVDHALSKALSAARLVLRACKCWPSWRPTAGTLLDLILTLPS